MRLSDLFEGAAPRAVPHAGAVIVPDVFRNFRYSAWAENTHPRVRPFELKNATLTDAYNAGNPLTYSAMDYERFPPWARLDVLERHLGEFTITDITADRGERPFLRSLTMDGYLEILQEQVRRKIENPPAAETSSWIAE